MTAFPESSFCLLVWVVSAPVSVVGSLLFTSPETSIQDAVESGSPDDDPCVKIRRLDSCETSVVGRVQDTDEDPVLRSGPSAE